MPIKKNRPRVGRRKKGTGSSLPKTALAIFLITAALLKSGAADKLEQSVKRAGNLFASAENSKHVSMNASSFDIDICESSMPYFPSGYSETLIETESPVSVTIDGSSGAYAGESPVYVKNETDYEIDIDALLSAPDKVELSGSDVQVLIMHTHGTEAYTPTSQNNYTPSDTDRTTDNRYNMVRVGDEITSVLNQRGIKTVHSDTLNDSPAYSGSYNRALEDITAYIKEYPSVKLVIDVHRDAITASDGTKYKTVAQIDGADTAQLMLVCGTDAGGLTHDSWQDNLSFQLKIQKEMNTHYPGIMRPLDIRAARFNQHVTPGSMILEVGTSGNTLEEALSSARLFAETLADMLLN